ncbi:hypothetical protein H0H93_000597 [Arthromyces matolae]|nr:hypothetical protein H0H93_000597 [Arthromyces matolae]
MNPSICPLCRKPFIPDRSKKLITGEIEHDSQATGGEIERLEDTKHYELLTKLIDSLGTDDRESAVLEVDMWLESGNTNDYLERAHGVFKEYLVLKSERSANIRSIRRLQRDMCRLQVDQENEKENASAIEHSLQSQIEELQTHLEGHRRSPTITWGHNPLPTPPEPFSLEALPFISNRQQNNSVSNDTHLHHSSDRQNGQSENVDDTREQRHPPLASLPTSAAGRNEPTSNYRSGIIPGASPNQRFVPGETQSGSAWANMYGQVARSVDPYALTMDYITEYASGYEEGFRMSQQYTQPSSSRRHRHRTRRPTDPSIPTTPSVEPPSESVETTRSRSDDVPHVFDSPASVLSYESWGTVNTQSPNLVPQPQPFRPAHHIESVSDLGLRLFDDLSSASNAGYASQRSSLLSDISQPFFTSPVTHNDGGYVAVTPSDSRNRTPRMLFQPLPATTESGWSSVTSLPPHPDQYGHGHGTIPSSVTHAPYRDLDQDNNQPQDPAIVPQESWYRAAADLVNEPIQSSSRTHSHSNGNSSSSSTRSSRTSRHPTSQPVETVYDNNTHSHSSIPNALGLTDLESPSPEPYISAPTPVTPSRSFRRFYEAYR